MRPSLVQCCHLVVRTPRVRAGQKFSIEPAKPVVGSSRNIKTLVLFCFAALFLSFLLSCAFSSVSKFLTISFLLYFFFLSFILSFSCFSLFLSFRFLLLYFLVSFSFSFSFVSLCSLFRSSCLSLSFVFHFLFFSLSLSLSRSLYFSLSLSFLLSFSFFCVSLFFRCVFPFLGLISCLSLFFLFIPDSIAKGSSGKSLRSVQLNCIGGK